MRPARDLQITNLDTRAKGNCGINVELCIYVRCMKKCSEAQIPLAEP